MSHQNGDRDSATIRPDQLTAYALGQLEGPELADIERRLAEPHEAQARQLVAETRKLSDAVRTAAQMPDSTPDRSPQLRATVLAHLEKSPEPVPVEIAKRPAWRSPVAWLTVGGAAAVLAAAIFLPGIQAQRDAARRAQASNGLKQIGSALHNYHDTNSDFTSSTSTDLQALGRQDVDEALVPLATTTIAPDSWDEAPRDADLVGELQNVGASSVEIRPPSSQPGTDLSTREGSLDLRVQAAGGGSRRPLLPNSYGSTTSPQGEVPTNDLAKERESYSQPSSASRAELEKLAQMTRNQVVDDLPILKKNEQLAEGKNDFGIEKTRIALSTLRDNSALQKSLESRLERKADGYGELYDTHGREQYQQIVENGFLAPTQHPLSTFSIDVDTASYANVRRFLTGGRLPPPAAVRIEELVNYFTYSYPQPKGTEPFSVHMETAQCPWQPGNLLLRVGLKGKEIHRAERPATNLVFLLDVSGSMADENKLPLLKTAVSQMVAELTENDRVSIVTYAGEAGLRLPPTSGDQKGKILAAIESLQSGGSTNGSTGIELAYEQAGQYFIKNGANRVILATDGDLNVGVTSDEALVELIKSKAAAGTFLTVLGFGEGNLQDAKLEKLADNGNGLYAYIDSVREGRKVLVEQLSGSTVTIAKDVKIQIEFNPAQIASFRALGYENRVLAAKDFNDDKKDAGEIGAGHTVTALYELVPVGKQQAAAKAEQPAVEPLKYQETGARGQGPGGQRSEVRGQDRVALSDAAASGELLTLKLRYKEPNGEASKLLEVPLKERGGQFNAASKDLQFAAAVASFGMILRGSEHKGSGNLAAVGEIAGGALGDDAGGYRAEFIDLVRRAQALGAR